MKRLYYLDNLRIFLSILVVLHHVSIGYGAMGGWCYVTNETIQGTMQQSLSALFGIEAFFSMDLFFFISAYLTTHSLDKKGARTFISRQFLRLGVPLLFVMVVFAPSLLYFIELYRQTTGVSWFDYVLQQNIYAPNTSHAWFILVLILFEVAYVFYWKYIRPGFSFSKHIQNNPPSHLQIALFILIVSTFTLLIRQVFPIGQNIIGLQPANFVTYTMMYALGILVSRKGWLDSLADKTAKSWFLISLPVAMVFTYLMFLVIREPSKINNFIDGIHLESISLAFIETIICIGFSGFFIQLFRKKLDFTHPVLKGMAANRYGVYIFHSAVVVGVTMLLEFIRLDPSVKFFIASALSVLFSFLLVDILRKIRPISRII